MGRPPGNDDHYRARRWAAARRRLRSAIAWTVTGLVVVVPLCAYAASPNGTAWTIGGGIVAAVLVLAFAALFAWRAAGRHATSELVRDWAAARGAGYWGRDMPAQPSPDPPEALFDLQQLADSGIPEATPLLRMGDRRYVTDVVAITIDGIPARIANHCYEEDTYGSKGERHTTYTHDLIALLEYPLRVTPMRVVRRSAVGRLLRGAGDAIRGIGAMRVEDLENDLFRERYAVEVADGADPVDVFAVFDPSVQERLAHGRTIPDIDLIEADGPWLLLAWSGELDGDELERLDVMVEAVRWGIATLGSRRFTER